MLILGWLIIGVGIGLAITSFTSGSGKSNPLWNVVAGAVGGLFGGFLFLQSGQNLVVEGPKFIVSILTAAVGALIAVILARRHHAY